MIKFNDVYVTTLARGLCQPNEQIISASAGSFQSFWTFKIPFFRHHYLFIATTDRLLVVDHRKGLIFDRLDSVASHAWNTIGSVKIRGLLRKRLVIKDTANRTLVHARLPPLLLNPIAKNEPAMRMLVQTWEQRRELGAAPAYDAMASQRGPAQLQPQQPQQRALPPRSFAQPS
jgi:hypothetical protein